MRRLAPGDKRHGTRNGYQYYGCRCEDCRGANRDHGRAEYLKHHPGARSYRTPPLVETPDDPRHGTANGYVNHGCRCQPCRDANAAAMREYRARLRDAEALL
jgi:hypothetical protein